MKKKSRIAIILALSLIISILPLNLAFAFGSASEAPGYLQVDEGNGGIYLFWDNIDKEMNKGLAYYELQVRTPEKNDYELLSQITADDEEDYWQSLEPDQSEFRYIHRPSIPGTYYYRLRAVYENGGTSEWISGEIEYAALKAPILEASTLGNTGIKLSWNRVKDADGYYIHKFDKSTGRPFPVETIKSGDVTSWIDKNVKKGAEYEYQIRPYIKVNGKIIENIGSDYVTAFVGVAKVKLTKITTASSSATIKWSKLPNVSGYEVYRANTASETYKKIKTITSNSTTFTDKKKTAGKKYYYKVRAYLKINGKKYNGAFSSSKSITISNKTLTQQQARKAYLALRNKSLYFPNTLIVNVIYTGTINGEKVIMIDYSAENAFGIRSRSYFTYWPSGGNWNHDYYLSSLKNKAVINKSKIIHWN